MLTLKEKTMLSDIPGDWDSKSLAAVLVEHYPGDWGEDRGPHMTKVLRSTNLTNEGRLDLEDIALRALPQRKAELLSPRRHDILLERSGGGPGQPVGRVGFIEADLAGHAFSNFLHLLRPDSEKINPRFLGWVLYRINQTGRIIRLEQQTTQMRNLNFRDYLAMPLPVPPLDEQAAIARILDAVDTAQERTRAAIAAAAGVRNALMWTLLERGIGENGQVRRPSDEAPDDYVGTRIGRIPKTWRIEPLGAIADVERGRFSPRPRNDPRYYGGKYPFIQTGQVAQAKGRVLMNATQSLNDAGRAVSREFAAGTIIVTIAANIGETAILGRPMCAPDSLVGVTTRNQHVPRYVELCLRRLRPRLAALAPRSAQANINLTFLRPLRIPVPPLQEQRRIAALIDGADSRVLAFETQLQVMETLKRSVMHDFLTGRVRVRDDAKAAAP